MSDLLARIWADDLTRSAIILVLVMPVLDLILGVSRSIADNTFNLLLLDVWIRVKIAGRVVPIIFVLLFGSVIGNVTLGSFSVNLLTTAGLAAAATFVASEAASIIASLQPTTPNPPPTE